MSLRKENSFVCGLIVSAGEFYSLFFFSLTRHLSLVVFVVADRKSCGTWNRNFDAFFLLLFVCFHSQIRIQVSPKKRSRLTFLKIESNPRLIIVEAFSWLFWFLIHCCFWAFFHWSILFSFYTLYNRRLSNECTTVLPLVLLVLVTLNLGSSPTMMMGNGRQRDWLSQLLARTLFHSTIIYTRRMELSVIDCCQI